MFNIDDLKKQLEGMNIEALYQKIIGGTRPYRLSRDKRVLEVGTQYATHVQLYAAKGMPPGFWWDFSENDGGDVIAYVAMDRFGGKSRANRVEAAKWLNEVILGNTGPAAAAPSRESNLASNKDPSSQPLPPPKGKWDVLKKHVPAPEVRELPPNWKKIFFAGIPDKIWEWRNTKGDLIGLSARKELPPKKPGEKGSKEVRPFVFCDVKNNKTGEVETRWHMNQMPDPRPLLYAEKIAKTPRNIPILVVEGEKATDAAQEQAALLFPDTGCVATTWIGGAGAAGKVDWPILKGRSVWFWPDADLLHEKKGYRASTANMERAAAYARTEGAKETRLVDLPYDVLIAEKKGWDLADPSPKALPEGWKRLAIESAEEWWPPVLHAGVELPQWAFYG